MKKYLPTSQGDLIKLARGERTQAAFAKELGVDRTCMSRYENERLGAPTKVLNHCLRAIAAHVSPAAEEEQPVQQALEHVRQAVDFLERATQSQRSDS
jgi:DNA-binding XRE family transcriptional regulator